MSLLEARPENIERHVINLLMMAPKQSMTGGTEAFPAYLGGSRDSPAGAGGKAIGQSLAPTSIGRRQSQISPDVLKRSAQGFRRQAISSKMNSSTDVQIKVIPKDEATFTALEATSRKVDLFHFLQDDQRRALINAMFRKEYADKETIIHEGDEADNFYIIESGRCKVFKKKGDRDVQVGTINAGQYFGELALINGGTRNASVIADGPKTVCWGLDQTSYLGLLKEHHGQKRQRYRTLLRNVPFLKALQDYEILLVADALQPVNPGDGEVIMKQGDSGDEFFIILEGECSVRKRSDDSEEKEVGRLKAGAYFGELALLRNTPRAATVIAGPKCKLIKLDSKSFNRLLGPCNQIFQENMKHYGES
jgi:cAMP-dependent protein kinase regulator